MISISSMFQKTRKPSKTGNKEVVRLV